MADAIVAEADEEVDSHGLRPCVAWKPSHAHDSTRPVMGNAASVAEAGRKQGNALYASGDLAAAVRVYATDYRGGRR